MLHDLFLHLHLTSSMSLGEILGFMLNKHGRKAMKTPTCYHNKLMMKKRMRKCPMKKVNDEGIHPSDTSNTTNNSQIKQRPITRVRA